MQRPVEIEFRLASVAEGDGATLAGAMAAEIAELYDGLDQNGPDMPRAGVAELGPPDGGFWVGYVDEAPVCCGGLKRLPDDPTTGERVCEIKKMYVVPQARGTGLSRRLLAFVEQQARARGYALARLDSGDRQPVAIHLYTSTGYTEIANFNANPVATYFAEKRLVSLPQEFGA